MNIILGLILALITFLLANGLFKLMNRPTITPIKREDRPNAALLVIDMQEDFTRMTGKMAHDPEKREIAIKTIDTLAETAKSKAMPVVEISHSFTAPHEKIAIRLLAGGKGVEGSQGLRRDPDLTFEADAEIRKHELDSFSAPAFERFLDDNAIGQLIITGQDATACVNSTAKAALKRGYDVTLITDAILARDASKWSTMREQLLKQGAKEGADIT